MVVKPTFVLHERQFPDNLRRRRNHMVVSGIHKVDHALDRRDVESIRAQRIDPRLLRRNESASSRFSRVPADSDLEVPSQGRGDDR